MGGFLLFKNKTLTKSEITQTPPPQKIEFKCIGADSSNFLCYDNYYRSLVKNSGIASAFDDLKKRYNENAYVKSQCHPMTHVIGRAATEIYPDVADAYMHGDSFCWSGYYHGAMEGIVAKIGAEELPNELNSICAAIPGKEKYSFDYFNCVHGLGHGLMSFTDNELFDSLKLCDNLDGTWEKRSCYGGVFMENVIVDNKDHFTKYLTPNDPVYPCNAVDVRYKNDCFSMQTSYMLKVTSNDFRKVFGLCAGVDEDYRAMCYQSLGRDASGQSNSNAISTKYTCGLGKDYFQKSNCVIGAVKDFISYFHSDVEAKQLCGSLDADLQSICFSTGETYYKNL